MNFHQVSRIKITPEVIDGIVFWTKNPQPMLYRLSELKNYAYYFQFTITPYGKDIEPNLPSKNKEILATFKRLSDMIGTDRVIWRFDPIMLSERFTTEYHTQSFNEIAGELHNFTRKVTISFLDENYRGVKRNIKELALQSLSIEDQTKLGATLASIAHDYGLSIDTCAEKIDLQRFGVEHARCIDEELLGKLLNRNLNVGKDKNQRLECACVTSVDIGMYNTCRNGCRYCYANYSQNSVSRNCAEHNPLSPLISGNVEKDDRITDRIAQSCSNVQANLEGLFR
jgi:DNA repair photolyase